MIVFILLLYKFCDFVSIPFEHEPIGLLQLIENKNSLILLYQAFAPAALPRFIAPGYHFGPYTSIYEPCVHMPLVIYLG